MALPEEDPDGDGRLTTINLRFPGQYFGMAMRRGVRLTLAIGITGTV